MANRHSPSSPCCFPVWEICERSEKSELRNANPLMESLTCRPQPRVTAGDLAEKAVMTPGPVEVGCPQAGRFLMVTIFTVLFTIWNAR